MFKHECKYAKLGRVCYRVMVLFLLIAVIWIARDNGKKTFAAMSNQVVMWQAIQQIELQTRKVGDNANANSGGNTGQAGGGNAKAAE